MMKEGEVSFLIYDQLKYIFGLHSGLDNLHNNLILTHMHSYLCKEIMTHVWKKINDFFPSADNCKMKDHHRN